MRTYSLDTENQGGCTITDFQSYAPADDGSARMDIQAKTDATFIDMGVIGADRAASVLEALADEGVRFKDPRDVVRAAMVIEVWGTGADACDVTARTADMDQAFAEAWITEKAPRCRDAYNVSDGLTYVITVEERVLRLEGNGDIHDIAAAPGRDRDIVYEGDNLDDAIAARDEWMEEHPCYFEDQGLSAIVSYHVLEGSSYDADGFEHPATALSAQTLVQEAVDRLHRYADSVDETIEDLGY